MKAFYNIIFDTYDDLSFDISVSSFSSVPKCNPHDYDRIVGILDS